MLTNTKDWESSSVHRNGTHCHIKWYQCQMGREEHWSIWGQNGAKMVNWDQNGEEKLYLGKKKYCKITNEIEKTLVRILNQNNPSHDRTPLMFSAIQNTFRYSFFLIKNFWKPPGNFLGNFSFQLFFIRPSIIFVVFFYRLWNWKLYYKI